MCGTNEGKTAQDVASIIGVQRGLTTKHEVKVTTSETRRRIEDILDELNHDEYQLLGVNYTKQNIFIFNQR